LSSKNENRTESLRLPERVKHYLRDSDGATQREIVENTGLAKSTVSETLTGLEEKDYIELDGTDGEGNLRRVWEGMA
jgi:predicted transcriptional regulator